jgi:hypothetical protein
MTDSPQTEERERIEHRIRGKAKSRVRKKLGFYWHFLVFVLANAAMIAINLEHSPDYHWFVWPLAGWGAALVLHGFATFQGSAMSEAMIEAEVKRELARRGHA